MGVSTFARMLFDLGYDTVEKVTKAIPEELQSIMDENSAFKTAFEALTPGRQRR